MRFTLIDRISDVQPGVSITAIKALSLAEEYLQDHFPRFPVMPGVLMMEALFQASALLVYKSEDFCHSTILLKEARNVKYADFVQPGQTLVVQAKIVKQDDSLTTLKATGTVGDKTAVTGKLVLERFNAVDRFPNREAWDARARKKMQKHFDLLHKPA
ncbi:MAG: beta-hydroxyacyl-ACP dehydratase [Planctomycetes bacterium]|nr:beta-hydroxyacyl-ACP dehydratase [Planctomycetota bacterium]MBL7044648.1 beta-hydroxyacyl-ACP dehydratase [Pirellulaceae bacterium]